jgi:O-antigen ligase
VLGLYRNLIFTLIFLSCFADLPLYMAMHGGANPNTIDPALLNAALTDSGGSTLDQVVAISSLINSILLVWLKRVPSRKIFSVLLPILPLLVWALISTAWSEFPDLTIRRSGRLAVATLSIMLLALTFDDKKSAVRLLYHICLALVCLDWLLLAMPSISMTYIGYAGAHMDKNTAGVFYFLALPIFAFAFIDRAVAKTPILPALAILASLPIFVHTGAKTAMVCVPLALLATAIPWLEVRSLNSTRLVLPIIFALLLGLVAALVLSIGVTETLQLAFGDASLTGRDRLWIFVLSRFDTSPVFGVGYGALFQTGPELEQYLINYSSFVANQSHNGYLDVMTQLGVIGLGFLIFYLVATAAQILRSMRAESDSYIGISSYAFYLFFGCLIYNVTDSIYFKPAHSLWIFLVFVIACATAGLRQGRPVTGLRRLHRRQPTPGKLISDHRTGRG